jgi:hypothetical protein
MPWSRSASCPSSPTRADLWTCCRVSFSFANCAWQSPFLKCVASIINISVFDLNSFYRISPVQTIIECVHCSADSPSVIWHWVTPGLRIKAVD